MIEDPKGGWRWSMSKEQCLSAAKVQPIMFYVNSEKVRVFGKLVRSTKSYTKLAKAYVDVGENGKRKGSVKDFRAEIRRVMEVVENGSRLGGDGIKKVLGDCVTREKGLMTRKLVHIWEELFRDQEFSDVFCINALVNEEYCKPEVAARHVDRMQKLRRRHKVSTSIDEERAAEASKAGRSWPSTWKDF